jgi:polyisoprenoid-binding protein YceI
MKISLIAAAAAALLATAAQAEPVTYKIEPTHTYATFEIMHFGTSTNRGRFDKKEGTVVLDKAAKTGKVDVTIDMTSIDSGYDAFNKHLQSAEIFDAPSTRRPSSWATSSASTATRSPRSTAS